MKVFHADGSSESIQLKHTYNQGQIDWFQAGSALNLIAGAKPEKKAKKISAPRKATKTKAKTKPAPKKPVKKKAAIKKLSAKKKK